MAIEGRQGRGLGLLGSRGESYTTRECGRASVRRRRQGGATLISLFMWSVFTIIGALAVARAVIGSVAVDATNRETTAAVEAASEAIESLQQYEFSEVFTRFNAPSADNPETGPSPGPGFAVPGLDPVAGDPDGLPGRINFPTAAGNGGFLAEGPHTRFAGMPADLNLDGDQLDLLTAEYKLLPVIVTVRWRGVAGERVMRLATVLVNDE